MKNLNEIRTCIFCGQDFNPQYGREGQRFCSNKCYLKNRWGEKQTPNICPICGNPATSTGKRNQVYCSFKCNQKGKIGKPNKARFNRITKKCSQCGKDVTRPVSNFHAEKIFCGYRCMAQWQSENTRQEAHPRWTGGSSSARGCGWKAARNEARRLSKGKCKACKVPANTVHHKIPVRCFLNHSNAHSQSNLVVLCSSCHPKIEKIFRDSMPLLNLARWQ